MLKLNLKRGLKLLVLGRDLNTSHVKVKQILTAPEGINKSI